jgi:hypothetical protein
MMAMISLIPDIRSCASPTRLLAAFTLSASFAMSPAAWAQALPDSLITATSFSADAKAQIKSLIDTNQAALSANDPAALRKARVAILLPLRSSGVTASPEFRAELGAQLRPVLDRLVSTNEKDAAADIPAINALALAGELATRDGVEVLIKGLSDPRPGVAVRAGLGLARSFVLLRDSSSPLVQSQVDPAIIALRATLRTAKHAQILEAAASALAAAASVPDAKLEGLRAKAGTGLIESMSALTQASGVTGVTMGAQLVATRSLFDRLSAQGADAGAISSDASIAIAGLAGDLLSAMNTAIGGELPEGERRAMAILAGQAERVYSLAHRRLDSQALPASLNLDALLREGKDDQFRTESAKLVGPAGVLTKPPFNIDGKRFAWK